MKNMTRDQIIKYLMDSGKIDPHYSPCMMNLRYLRLNMTPV
jgi:hypothetical protein